MPGLRPLEHEPGVARRRLLRDGLEALADLLFPPFCPVCGDRLGAGRRAPLCARCWAALPRIAAPLCESCGAPFGTLGTRGPGTPPRRCAGCRRRAPRWSYARAAGRFEGPLREALHAFKFDGRRALARPLGDLLAETGAGLPLGAAVDVIVPVPLHPARRRARGFNQSQLLARRLGRAWALPVAEALARVAPTRPQVELSAAERRGNVRGAFRVRRPAAVAGRHVLLVDDVLTTGATAEECAARLREAGATRVGVLTVARA
jgi:ComF family protein